MIAMFKDLYYSLIDLWVNDRKEFWDMVGGFAIVVFWFWVTFFVLLPIFAD
jgi:hypothetical protein